MVRDGIDECGELALVAKGAGANGVEDLLQVGVDAVLAVGVRVAEVFDVFGEVAKEEDVGFANLTSDFDLEGMLEEDVKSSGYERTHVCAIACSDNHTAVEHKLHVARATCFRACSGDVLADVGSRDDDLGLADVVVLDEDDFQ